MPANTVDVFWDFGSCPAPAETSGYAIANRLRTLALRLGAVRSFRAYLAVSSHSDATSNGRALALRSELQSSGVSLIDSPGGKDVADKMLIADMFTHVFEKAALAPSNVIMLISSDPSYAYVLSVLQMRSQRIVLLGSGLDGVAAGLASQATAFLDWDTEILADTPKARFLGSSPKRPTIPALSVRRIDWYTHPSTELVKSATQTSPPAPLQVCMA
ncbi:hypothetical protein DFP72DRAFT_799130 [Ephemerocybe angulata]|uniref:NYN domain-containing protein n=1 Tax=Ephemerocybe angulata TaxID=980116 RepID=A0A8H6IFV1_9AGAR|nr:hypothetical protein DFP72DRAFT_799130 [Tulosesus angulatus]